MSRILSSFIEADPALQVVGIATDGAEAIRLTARWRPNIITMDVNMPRMGGLEATEYIMAHQPTPILVLTAYGQKDINLSFKMLSAGALEFLHKPDPTELQLQRGYLLDRIKLLSRIKVITHVRGKYRNFQELPPLTPATNPTIHDRENFPTAPLDPSQIYKPTLPKPALRSRPASDKFNIPTSSPPVVNPALLTRRFDAIGIAASTGGPPALAHLLRDLPVNLPAPLFVVQHIPAGFSAGLAEWLNGETRLAVKMAQEGEVPQPGVVYLPADDHHLAFWPDGRCRLDSSPARYSLRPSADITFASMSKTWPGKTLSLILTGMGRDGSVGMRDLFAAGGYNIAQDEASSVIYGMPKAAVELGVVHEVMALGHMAHYIKQIFKLTA